MKKTLLPLLAIFLSSCSPLHFSTEPESKNDLPRLSRVKVALVLGGGGAKGMAHVGVIEELIKAGIYPDLIVGCSAGAIVGGLFADQPDVTRLKDLLLQKRRKHLLNISLFNLPFGLTDGNALQEFLEENLQSKTFAELKIPFIAVATNLQHGTHMPFGSGPLISAIRASACFPGMFHPVSINGQYYVDGGVTDNLPSQVARRMGAEYVIAVELETELPLSPPTNAMGIAKRSLEISLKYQNTHGRSYANKVIKVHLPGIGTFEDEVNEQVYNKGREAGRLAAPKIKAQLPAD